MKFSERIGESPARMSIQGRSLDEPTRNRLWSAVLDSLPDAQSRAFSQSWMFAVYRAIWAFFLRKPLDELSYEEFRVRDEIKPIFLSEPWYRAYDLIEFLIGREEHGNRDRLRENVARILEEEKAGFRLSGNQFVEITDPREVAAIEAATAIARDRFAPVRIHLDAAVRLYSDRHAPDYRNSIKEYISAVESVAQILTGDARAELGKALALLEKRAPLHGAFASALRSLYGYSSDAGGIRHALSDEPTLDAADAKFMLVACAAFVSYAIQKTLP